LIGAGIPLKIPGVLDLLANHQPATYELQVTGAQDGDDTTMHFVPREYMERELPPLARPYFLGIVASNTLAVTLMKRANGKVDGFVVEGPTAGGHNAPPRGKMQLNESGGPIYGGRDTLDLVKMKAVGLPFWLAGGYGTAKKLREALAAGATGVQVGTAFAFCAESGLREDYKQGLLQKAIAGEANIFADPSASPTGYPFKAAQLERTLSEPDVCNAKPRIGYLREAYRTPEGAIEYCCAGEPVSVYVSKGGQEEATVGRKCLCNALLAKIGMQQVRGGKYEESGMVTGGDDLTEIPVFLSANKPSYTAAEVIWKTAWFVIIARNSSAILFHFPFIQVNNRGFARKSRLAYLKESIHLLI
jgi:nitronate monooxygenase